MIGNLTLAPGRPGSPERPDSPVEPLGPTTPGGPRSPVAPCDGGEEVQRERLIKSYLIFLRGE